MSQFGFWGSWPLEWGGGPSSAETVYDALRSALGGPLGGELGPVDGIDDTRIMALAVTIDAVGSLMDAAAMQAFPAHASHLLDVIIDEFGLDPKGDDELARAAILERETEELASDMDLFELALVEISSKLSVLTYPDAENRQTLFGRSLAPQGGGANGNSSMFPGFSDRDVLRLRYTLDVPAGELTIPAGIRSKVSALVSTVMPAWVDFSISVPGVFYCDGGVDGTSLLDQTPMG